ncbi:MAG TPA: flagellar FlbD family protein [Acidobacteriaceae bacterium]|nr:flagellar FlbD family protein [Acidobacteriaceae bacterium]
MIELTRLNGQKLFVNCDLLKYAEASPDTVLTLLTGEKIVVRESCAEVIALGISFRARVLGAAWPDSAAAPTALRTQFALNPPTPSTGGQR